MHTDTGSILAANAPGNIALQPASIREKVVIRPGCRPTELNMNELVNFKQRAQLCDSVDQSSAPVSAAPANTLADVGE